MINKQSKSLNSTINEIHLLRALACICVVLVHLTAIHYVFNGNQFNEITFGINQLARFGTPTFAVISAFLLVYQVRRKGFQLKNFIVTRTTKIVFPFFIWSLFYIGLNKIYFGVGVKQGLDPISYFIEYVVLGGSYYHLYFMAMVLQFYLLFIVIQFARTKFVWGMLLIIALIVNAIYLTPSLNLVVDQVHLKKIYYSDAFVFRWIFYFMLGGFIAYFWENISEVISKYKYVWLLLGVLVVIGGIIEYNVTGSAPASRITNLINIPVLTLSVFSLYKFINNVSFLENISSIIGKYAMGIYILHPFILFIMLQHVPSTLWRTYYLPVYLVIILFICIIISKMIGTLKLSNYILPVPKTNSNNTKARDTSIAST
ncbi:acyltransferase [Sutcliffiella horikoshii]|uniref:acyltransferase n=1 Tax=Sutcliffiella horikoshii TaxID=79883 RepID=UPI001F48A11F|nr:acyltransferase [Sutcliffiella horikoshii]MCG1021594.1 acyltransferase [Sutcliffiella horikoshii]